MRVMLVALLTLLIAGTAAATPLVVAFDTPAQYAGSGQHSNVTWAVIVFAPQDAASVELQAPSVDSGTNHSTVRTKSTLLGASQSVDRPIQSRDQTWTGPMETTLEFDQSWSSVWIEGNNIQLRFSEASGQMLTSSDPRAILSEPSGIPPGTIREPRSIGPAFESTPNIRAIPFQVAGNVTRIEWHNATTTCPASPCPDGAKSVSLSTTDLQVSSAYFAEWNLIGQINGHGTAYAIASGGTEINLNVNGTVRLPRAANDECQACGFDANSTLTLNGQTELRGIQNAEPGRLSANLAGTSQARLDESAIKLPNWQTPAAGAAAAVVVSFLLWKLVLAGLVSRLADPLENDTRRRVMDAIQDNPGITCRELQRNLTLGNGTVIHHLHVLQRHKLIAQQTDGNKRRLFENHGKYHDNWRLVSLLRQTPHRELLEWLAANKEVVQKQVLAWATERGWKRTATQARLHRLMESGLIAVERRGRMQVYRTIQPFGLLPQSEAVDSSVA